MKRKLISFDAFRKMTESSLSNASKELSAAEEILADVLEENGLDLHCFGDSDVVYETTNGDYVHANYVISKHEVVFENIEKIVVDADTEKAESRKTLRDLLESLLEDNKDKAGELLSDYLEFNVVKGSLLQEDFKVTVSKPSGKHSKLWGKKQSSSTVAKRIREMKKTKAKLKNSPGLKASLAQKKKSAASGLGKGNSRWRVYARKVKNMKEWNSLCENVFDYVLHNEYGPVTKNLKVEHDEKNNVVSVSIPTEQKRNEAKVQTLSWKNYDNEMKVLRGNVKRICENNEFCKAVAYLKKQNNISNDQVLENTLEEIAQEWPDLIYLTQSELAGNISTALESLNVSNYDDDICEFMAEGILLTIFENYSNRVEKIMTAAGHKFNENSSDKYNDFKNIVEELYPQLDETEEKDVLVFSDLYKALKEVHDVAREIGDEATVIESSSYLKNCLEIINKEEVPSVELAGNIAEWIYEIVESNLEGNDSWNYSEKMPLTTSGDPDELVQKSRKSYTPAQDFRGETDLTPVSDGKSRKGGEEMKKNSWSNYGDKDTYPDLKNPVLPNGQNPSIKGEKSVDSEEGLAGWDSSDTFPRMSNPYLPKAVMFKAQD